MNIEQRYEAIKKSCSQNYPQNELDKGINYLIEHGYISKIKIAGNEAEHCYQLNKYNKSNQQKGARL